MSHEALNEYKPRSSGPIRRRPDGSIILPPEREPSCIHSGIFTQPASACNVCKDSPELANWRRQWAAYIEEHPESEAARWVRSRKRLPAE